jgi:hypothetical protein
VILEAMKTNLEIMEHGFCAGNKNMSNTQEDVSERKRWSR